MSVLTQSSQAKLNGPDMVHHAWHAWPCPPHTDGWQLHPAISLNNFVDLPGQMGDFGAFGWNIW